MTPREAEISIEQLHKLLRLDPETGRLFWRERTTDQFKEGEGRYTAARAAKIWNSRYANKPALAARHKSGYLQGKLFYTDLLAHRVVWALYHEAWPDGHIDHINGDRADNRPVNLRDVDRSANMKNQSLSKANTAGATGVYHFKQTGQYDAYITDSGKREYLGRFDTLAEAASARRQAERRLGFHPNHGRSTQ